MAKPIVRIPKNSSPLGRDWVVPDIHGYFNKLKEELTATGFSPEIGDRLFVLGDLVDRGPDSNQVLDWLNQPWLYSIQGNHEDLAVLYVQGVLSDSQYRKMGGGWNVDNPIERQIEIALRFQELPIAIELETPNGLLGLVHANVPYGSWGKFKDEAIDFKGERLSCKHLAQWDQSRINGKDESLVEGIDNVIVGHSFVVKPTQLGNVLHLDTGGWIPPNLFRFYDASNSKLI